ncbi:hypothetical protein NL108_014203 [Boleophthalmus pectinirostris]|uniref:uncharacterized protein LOC110160842 n=1 Tax=Boleophthalmus pectinirostris TaxID=150288 RepID=UPI00242C1172|nr:uncharacterized protein LOC110160842 [Boleophthalmus pectinirostris]KAJ0055319.1 hypothetical protein NL108_014203 [Boleophthalmus pectinirostris]
MVDTALCLEALSALSGCSVQQSGGASQLGPQDFVNIVALRQFYKREGLEQLEYPSLGSMSLRDDAVDRDMDDLYSAPPALTAPPPAPESRPVARVNPDDFFDRKFDYDFTNIKDGERRFVRGDEPYFRPCGWRRVALNVSGKYDDGSDVWLGTGSQAWPVSYQGLHMDGSLILTLRKGSKEEGGLLDEAAQSLMDTTDFGRGIYSTPDVLLAEKHCKTFKSSSNGKTYKVLLQNRISPSRRKVCERDRVWVVYVPQDHSQIQTRALVQESVRPYGLLLKEA